MNLKITSDHLARAGVVYVRQSTPQQTVDHTESQRRQYALAEAASSMGFASVETIDEDQGRSASGMVDRPGFQRLVAAVCNGSVGAVFCIEASRLSRNGRDWHHLIDLCAIVGTLVIDPEGVYDPRLSNDRLLLGLKGTMSEYELSLLRQRGLAARDAKAKRGELRCGLPPGYCWDDLGRIEIDPDERVTTAIRTIFRKFQELGSARQVLLWALDADLKVPIVRQGVKGAHLDWRIPAYHNILTLLRNPVYAGSYVFGRTENRVRILDGRACKTAGHKKPPERWSVLLHDHHEGFITLEEFERNQTVLSENAHIQKRAARKSGRGGRALLTGLARCGRCGRMLRVLYGSRSGHAHRYQCKGDEMRKGSALCVGVGGVRVDRAVSKQLLSAVAPHAIESAIEASCQVQGAQDDIRRSLLGELEEAKYEASLAAKRHEAVDPAKRLVARELERRWEDALERVRRLEQKLAEFDASATSAPEIDQAQLLALAQDLPAVWNSPRADARLKQSVVRTLVEEVVVDLDEESNECVLVIHWQGGRHSEVRVARVRSKRNRSTARPNAVDVIRKLGGHWPDRQLAVTMNRMRCESEAGRTWTAVRVRELRERLGVEAFDPSVPRTPTVSADEAASRLSVCVGSIHRLIREGVLSATQLMPSAPWEIPLAALDSEAVRIGVQGIIQRRPRNTAFQRDRLTPNLPGMDPKEAQ